MSSESLQAGSLSSGVFHRPWKKTQTGSGFFGFFGFCMGEMLVTSFFPNKLH